MERRRYILRVGGALLVVLQSSISLLLSCDIENTGFTSKYTKQFFSSRLVLWIISTPPDDKFLSKNQHHNNQHHHVCSSRPRPPHRGPLRDRRRRRLRQRRQQLRLRPHRDHAGNGNVANTTGPTQHPVGRVAIGGRAQHQRLAHHHVEGRQPGGEVGLRDAPPGQHGVLRCLRGRWKPRWRCVCHDEYGWCLPWYSGWSGQL
ncbi:hypothetical protein IWX50DRAFT_632109 [Phyllosticta citricarpa]